MTKLALALILALVVYGGIQYSKPIVYEAPVEVVTPKDETPEWAKDPEAVKAAQEVVKKKALEAELIGLHNSFASSTSEYEARKKDFLEKQKSLQKEIGIY